MSPLGRPSSPIRRRRKIDLNVLVIVLPKQHSNTIHIEFLLAAWADTGQFSALTVYDLMLIRVLYDGRIEPGMNAEQAHRAARQIHQELTRAE